MLCTVNGMHQLHSALCYHTAGGLGVGVKPEKFAVHSSCTWTSSATSYHCFRLFVFLDRKLDR